MYSQSACKRPPWEFTKAVATRAGCLREWAHGKTISKGWSLTKDFSIQLGKMLIVTSSGTTCIVAESDIIVYYCLPQIEEVRKCTGHASHRLKTS